MSTLRTIAVAERLVADLGARGVAVTLDGDALRIRALRGAIGADDRAALAAHKAEIVGLLVAGGTGSATTAPDPAAPVSPGALAQAEAEYEQMYWGRIIPLGDARRAAIERGDHAEAARLGAEKGALAAGEYTDARRRYLALVNMYRAVNWEEYGS